MMTNSSETTSPLADLYERDYYLWLETTTKLLEEGKLTELDAINLREEIADMGRSEKRLLESNLEILLMHLIKYKYQSQKRSNSWRYTIYEHRKRINKSLKESSSLNIYFKDIFSESYLEARKMAAIETGLDISNFPKESPFIPEETLDCDCLT